MPFTQGFKPFSRVVFGTFALALSFLGVRSTVAEVVATEGILSSGELSTLAMLYRDQASQALPARIAGASLAQPIAISSSVPGLGNMRISFRSLRAKTWHSFIESSLGVVEDPAEVVLLQGVLQIDGAKELYRAAGAISEVSGEPVLTVNFLEQLSGSANSRELVVSLDSGVTSLRSRALADLSRYTCGADASHLSSMASKALSGDVGVQSLKAVELSTDGDYEWYSDYGSSSNTTIATLVNAVNTIYQVELGLDLEITQQHVWSSSSQPLTATNSDSLLVQFQGYNNSYGHLGTADVYHLFSGKDFDDYTVGLAYMGVVCDYPTYSYGMSQALSGLTHLIAAHEIGHNFNADHDTSTPRSIMFPSVGSDQTSFSQNSRTVIANYVAASGSCLSDSSAPDPRADIPVVTMSSSFSKTSGALAVSVSVSNTTRTDCSISLQFAKSSSYSSARRKSIGTGVNSATAQASLPTKVYVPSGGSNSVYVRALYSCSGSSTVYSSGKRIRIPKSSSQSKPSISSWIRQAVRRLTPAV